MTPIRFWFLLILAFACRPSFSLAQEIGAEDANPIESNFAEIRIEGNNRTHDQVLLRELDFVVGDPIDDDLLAEGLTRLRNLRIFTSVVFEEEVTEGGQRRLVIRVQERWTAIPIAKFGSAGGTSFYTLGAFDINFLGRYMEVGAQYDNLNGRDGGVTWFRNPRLFGERLLFGYDLWLSAQNRELYDGGGDRVSAFTVEKTRFHFFLQKEIHRLWGLGVGIDYVDQKISDDHLSDRQLRSNQTSNFDLPPSSEQTAIELTARFGRLNFDNYLVEGIQSDWLYRLAIEGVGSKETANQLTIENRAFFRLFENHNIGIDLSFGHTTADLLQDQFYLGGLAEVRGYRDGQFVGSDFWRANLEYRLPSVDTSWLVIQHVAFFDIGSTGNSFAETFENETFNSLGIGLRLISPKIFRLNVRIDYARTFGRDRGGAFSFGLQQFF